MIIVTGAAGFIGSCLISRLNEDKFRHIIAVDDFSDEQKNANLEGKTILQKVHRDDFFGWLAENYAEVEFCFHIGARTDTTEQDWPLLERLNFDYSKQVWQKCHEFQIPLVYASSAATYGLGEHGYEDNEAKIALLKPLNLYGESKNNFDIWALAQTNRPFFWAGLKFFNVYGPNEYHKGRMASVIWHAFQQIQLSGQMKLFKSHNHNYANGGQMRDFVYVKDVLEVCIFLMYHRRNSGIYNLGTGQARSFQDLAASTFEALDKPLNISYIDTPEDIREKYQYFTEASMNKLKNIGYNRPFTSLEAGVADYVGNYLLENKYL
jgi:ADP-L-glycero-D-manno-heptose 6-epimerase